MLLFCDAVAQQKEVSITIDDVPNIKTYQGVSFSSQLLGVISTLELPVAIFINEKNIYGNEFIDDNRQGLIKWLNSPNVTAGNHTFSHLNYSDTTLVAFKEDIEKGTLITSETLKKNPKYFRFPYNNMGKDSMAHHQVKEYLKESGYINTPFTIESEDWVFNSAYEDAWKKGDIEKAEEIGHLYVAHTVRMFEYFEKVCRDVYGRNIRHIYLCHDNRLNADYLMELLTTLTKQGYKYVSLDDALKDKIYRSKDYYTGPFGFSWVYRWQQDEVKRKELMRQEPANPLSVNR
jgi:peptidoglycan/xylan/chitin deacetylase (PgdA/CDA1 family)